MPVLSVKLHVLTLHISEDVTTSPEKMTSAEAPSVINHLCSDCVRITIGRYKYKYSIFSHLFFVVFFFSRAYQVFSHSN